MISVIKRFECIFLSLFVNAEVVTTQDSSLQQQPAHPLNTLSQLFQPSKVWISQFGSFLTVIVRNPSIHIFGH